MFNFLKKKEPNNCKILLTSRGFSGTIFMLSFLSKLQNAVVAWKYPGDSTSFNGITIFGQENVQKYALADEKELKKIPLTKIFSRMIAKQTHADLYCVGHWLNLYEVESKHGSRYLKRKGIKLINLIRHPIDRTHSNWHGLRSAFSLGMPDDHKQGFITIINSHKSWLNDFLKKYNISLQNRDDAAFIGACLNLFGCSRDASYSNYKHIKIESLDNETLKILVNNLSNEKIKLEADEIQQIKTIRNSHTSFYQNLKEVKHQDKSSITTQEKFLSWSPWQRELYKLCILKSKLNKHYEKYQYHLFLD